MTPGPADTSPTSKGDKVSDNFLRGLFRDQAFKRAVWCGVEEREARRRAVLATIRAEELGTLRPTLGGWLSR